MPNYDHTGIPVCRITFDSQRFQVFKTFHAEEKRGSAKWKRDHIISPENYQEIITLALINGLTSFRREDKIRIFFKFGQEFHCLLVSINDMNFIKIHTVLIKAKEDVLLYPDYSTFRKVKATIVLTKNIKKKKK